jgi:omega-6 fatty acid desaturase (delta-12 desaturase)
MDDDEVFVPYTLSEYGGMVPNPADECPGPVACALRITQILKMLTFGWPAYLAMHVTGKRYPQRTSHFEPSSPIFTTKDFMDVVISDIVLLAVVSGLGLIGWTHGFVWLTKVYVIPYLFVNMWLVMYTDLQHTDTRLPHYRGAAMEWMKGALCTMDRNYGIFNEIHHHIGDTHVCHHLFSYMPHYHAEEASEAIKPVLGQYYLVDNKQPGILGIAAALYETASQCRYVDDVGEVLWWKRSVPKKTE